MKKIALFSILFAFAQAASATQILSYYTSQKADGKIAVNIYQGFMEDGFTRAEGVCYMGSVQGVCGLIKKAQTQADDRYSNGDHGTFTIKSCKVEGNIAKLNYDRVNDYTLDPSDVDIKLDIKSCSDQD